MRPDLVVEARAYVRGQFQDVEIGIDHETGRVLAVKKNLPGGERLRLPGKIVVPSAVDAHVHFRDPGAAHKEDFRTGTIGAARGGVGTVLDMPNTRPVVDRRSRLHDKIDAVAAKACVDWGLWCTLTPATPNPLEVLLEADGYKLYLSETTGIEPPEGTHEVRTWLEWARRAERVVAVHAERPRPGAPSSLPDHDRLRPALEETAAFEALAAQASPDLRLHAAHASVAATVAAARRLGRSSGVTPHHLLLSNDQPLGAFGKVNPPLRPPDERDALWAAFARGDVPIIETDHAPHTMDEKALDLAQAPSGVPGVETAFPLLLRSARERGVDPGLVVRAYCEAPADLMGLPKGRLEEGRDADFVVVDPRRTIRVEGARLASKCGWTPFEGWSMYPVEAHYLRGEPIVEDGEFIGKVGGGRRVRRTNP